MYLDLVNSDNFLFANCIGLPPYLCTSGGMRKVCGRITYTILTCLTALVGVLKLY